MPKENKIPPFVIGATFAFLTVLHTVILSAFNDYVTVPYMDEYFHYDQLKAYADDGNFSYWNDKLTTPPGLYLVDMVIIQVCRALGMKETKLLNLGRSINAYLYSLASIWILYKIFNFYYSRTERVNFERALFIHFLPTHFFFHFLLYTDSGSTFFILLAYYLTLCNRTNLGAFAAFISVLFRQTNIVWIGYFCLRKYIHDKRHHFVNQDNRLPLLMQVRTILERAWDDKWVLMRKFKFYVALLLSFIGFLYVNKGVVLGDRTNHEPSFHPTQLLYFLLFSLPQLSIPLYFYLFNFKMTLMQIFRQPKLIVVFLLLTAAFAAIVSQYTITHKFILADNRHYIFYIWKNFFLRYEHFKYLLCPFYAISLLFILPPFISSREKVLVFALWLLCTAVVLLPAKLVEFRYYTIPLILLQLEIKPFSIVTASSDQEPAPTSFLQSIKNFLATSVLPQILVFIAFNLVLHYIFLFKPFTLADGETGRFMW